MHLLSRANTYLPCENDQAEADRISRLARSTLLSKILKPFRLSGSFWIEAPELLPGVLELGAHRPLPPSSQTAYIHSGVAAFLRELFKITKQSVTSQAN
jgi:hypothetical protein